MTLKVKRLPLGAVMALFALLALVPLLLLTLLSIRRSTEAVQGEVRARVHAAAADRAEAVATEMEGLADLVDSYARRPSLIAVVAAGSPQTQDAARLRLQLRQLHVARRGIATAFLVEPDGKVIDIVPPSPEIVGSDLSFRDWHRAFRARTEPYVSAAFVSRAQEGGRVVAAAALVRDPPEFGERRGILVAAYSVKHLQEFVERFATSDGLRVRVTDQRGVVIAAPGGTSRRLTSIREDPLVAAALAGRRGIVDHAGPAGTELSAYAPVRGVGWTVTASVPRETAFARVDALRSAVLSIASVLVLVLLAGLGTLGRALWQRGKAERRVEDALGRVRLQNAALGVARDELRGQNRKLRDLDELKDEFVASVSHELRTPLTSIRGYLELVRDGEAGELTAEQDNFLAVVDRNVERLHHLVGDLLFSAQVDARRLVLEDADVDLAAVADDAIESARPLAGERGIELDAVTVPLVVRGDRARLTQVVDNLVSNALKFTSAGGRVTVCVRPVDGSAVLEVSDTGIGVPADELGRLFDRFFRARAASDLAIQGTGLGLSIAKAIVEAHNGLIVVESAEQVGSTFRVELPLPPQQASVAA